MSRQSAVFIMLTLVNAAQACSLQAKETIDRPAAAGASESPREAVAVLQATAGHSASGTVRFSEVPGGVQVIVALNGLKPDGTHGFHIHEYGDVTAADATSAGGHYNPEAHPHAGPEVSLRHAGDLGNVRADADGKVHKELTVQNITIAGAKNPIVGRSVVVHERADDLKSQPTGDAGGRIAVGVIGIAKSAESMK